MGFQNKFEKWYPVFRGEDMDLTFWTIIGTGLGVVTLVYSFIRDFRADLDARFDKMSERFDKNEQKILEANKRMDGVYNLLLQRMEKS